MSFKLSHVDLDADFGELMEAQWASYENPPQSFYRWFCPIMNDDREASLKESTTRLLEWDKHDSHALWLKVEDTTTGKIVGGAWYKIYTENPFEHPEEEIADWYPEDSSRDFVTQAIAHMDAVREQKARCPQVYLNILFTHPDYYRKGIGSKLVQWGIDKANELNVEFWLNATVHGKPLYETLGFKLVSEIPTNPKTDNPDEKWKECEEKWGDVVFYAMYRPKKE